MTFSRSQRVLGWVTLSLLGVLLIGIVILKFSVSDLNTDDELINRGQQATNCIGDRADAIDDWRAIFLSHQVRQGEEFLVQVERVQAGDPIDVSRARAEAMAAFDAEDKIRRLVEEKREIREAQLSLIDSDDPGAVFVCPPIADDLVPPPL